MRKHFHMFVIFAVVLLVPSMVFAGHKFAATQASSGDNVVTVPLAIENDDNLAAIDIPLSFNDGVTLKEVSFEDTRVDYFDLKIANINNEENWVVIGLLPQMTPKFKPDLAAGTIEDGPIANLVFEVDDPSVTEITLDDIVLKDPDHSLQFVYHDGSGQQSQLRVERPEFDQVTFSLSGDGDDPSLPDTYALQQNYPNPFNPSTQIEFALPEAAHVTLTVYNVLGQKVETLVDGRLEAGPHSITWNADSYGSGVYFYRMATDKFNETKKMVLLK